MVGSGEKRSAICGSQTHKQRPSLDGINQLQAGERRSWKRFLLHSTRDSRPWQSGRAQAALCAAREKVGRSSREEATGHTLRTANRTLTRRRSRLFLFQRKLRPPHLHHKNEERTIPLKNLGSSTPRHASQFEVPEFLLRSQSTSNAPYQREQVPRHSDPRVHFKQKPFTQESFVYEGLQWTPKRR